ncbi:CotH kinase family protein [bacterium]|nr:CotH kinase family protein [bacterium]
MIETRKNRLLLIFILIGLPLLSPLFADFFSDTVHTVRVYFDEPDFWPALDATHTTEEYIMCSVVFDAVDTLDSVGIRLKGNSSYGHPGNKKPFHLKIDEYIEDRDYRGNERLSYNNGFKDPTFLREKLATEIFHGLGVPCPRATWSVVYYNDEYWGFYTTVDPINKDALTRFFGENDCNLYKGDPNGTLEWFGWTVSAYRTHYEKATNETADDWTDLIEFCNFLNNSSDTDFGGINEWFDAIGFARMWAANTFLVNLDSYQGTGHNYYLYFDSDTIGRYIVQDVNEAFGVFSFGMSGSAMRTMAIDWMSSDRPLAERLFDDWTPFARLVDCAIHELLETTLEYSTFAARVTVVADLVRPYVYADDNKMFTNADFETNLDDDIVSGGGHPPGSSTIPGLRDFIYDRGIYLASVIGPCDPVNVSGAVLINEVMADNDTIIADEMGEFDDWFEIYNPGDTTVDISNWWVSDDVTEPRKWSFPNGTTVPSDGYLLVWADSDPEQGDLHTSFKLSAGGEELALSGSDFIGAQLCDSVSWTAMPTDSSWGRYPNGGVTWQICSVATPEEENMWSVSVEEAVELPKELSISVFPNPFNSAVSITATAGAKIEIFDVNGRMVDNISVGTTPCARPQGQAHGPAPTKAIWQPVENITSGVYLVRVKAADNEVTTRIVYLK